MTGRPARAAALVTLVLSACAPAELPQQPAAGDVSVPTERSLFGEPRPWPPERPNAEITRDFIALNFRLESGREVPRLTRFSQPVSVALRGRVPATADDSLGRLLSRLRNEAGLRIHSVPDAAEADINVEFLPRREISDMVPRASCFVVPRVASWAEFADNRRGGRIDWTTLQRRNRAAVFIATDTAPQEIRDCLHEELAQALGPLNDLYRLPDSVFNDDNLHGALTGFDMLVLRAHYDAALENGMNRAQVASRLPGILRRLNPAGARTARVANTETPPSWVEAIETALGPGASGNTRRGSAERALRIARTQGWRDTRMGLSLFTLGRLARRDEGLLALKAFIEASRVYRALPGGALHAAHVDVQLAGVALSAGQFETARAITERALAPARRGENAALVASLMMIRAAALDGLGRTAEAEETRLDSVQWARYGFGSSAEIRARREEVAELAAAGREANGS